MAEKEDVIELGSSDDEPDSAESKKIKRPLNAMVSIPNHIKKMVGHMSGIGIKKTNTAPINNSPTGNKLKVLKLSTGSKPINNPFSNTPNSMNGKQVQPQTHLINPIKVMGGPPTSVIRTNPNLTVKQIIAKPANPVHIAKRLGTNSKQIIGKVVNVKKGGFNPLAVGKIINSNVQHKPPQTFSLAAAESLKKPSVVNTGVSSLNPLAVGGILNRAIKHLEKSAIPIIKPKNPISLPAGITVKRTTGQPKRKLNTVSNANEVLVKKPKLDPSRVPGSQVGDILTVELDDDDIIPTKSEGPQWYVRPEDQNNSENKKNKNDPNADGDSKTEENTMETENNSEPKEFIEITIEDSPAKPLPYKRAFEVGAELAITIEDSPYKDPENVENGSDVSDDGDPKVVSPQSKKQLQFSKDVEKTQIEDVPQPELSNSEQCSSEIAKSTEKNPEAKKRITLTAVDKDKEVQEGFSTKLKTKEKSNNKVEQGLPSTSQEKPKGEFHEVYQEFIDLCFKLENSDDMNKIVEKKIKAYYRKVDKDYTESEEFVELVSSKISAMKADPDKMYWYIKDVVDDLSMQRKAPKSATVEKGIDRDEAGPSTSNIGTDQDEEVEPPNRNVRKLEKTLRKLHRSIQKLEEQEVDFDDDADSVYLLTERYKERLIRVHTKLCQLTGTKMPSQPKVSLEVRPGRPKGPVQKLEKWINKKAPPGAPLRFPDFHDVVRCVRDSNSEEKYGWSEMEIMDEARDLFTRCGKKLQRRRQELEWRIASSRLPTDPDPAEEHTELREKLEDNKTLASKKETDVINKYADRQNQLKLEAVEIGDKEAEESPISSDDDCQAIEDETTAKNPVPIKVKEEKKDEHVTFTIDDNSSQDIKSISDEKDDLSNDAHNVESKTESAINKKTYSEVSEITENIEVEIISVDKKDELKEVVSINSLSDNEKQNVSSMDKENIEEIKSDEEKDCLSNVLIQTIEGSEIGTDESLNAYEDTSEKHSDREVQDVTKEVDAEISQNSLEESPVEQMDVDENNSETNSRNEFDSVAENENRRTPSATKDTANIITSEDTADLDDGDVLHLLKETKHASDGTTTFESSDIESRIAISDTTESSNQKDLKQSSDVVSIENSSSEEGNKRKVNPNTFQQKLLLLEVDDSEDEVKINLANSEDSNTCELLYKNPDSLENDRKVNENTKDSKAEDIHIEKAKVDDDVENSSNDNKTLGNEAILVCLSKEDSAGCKTDLKENNLHLTLQCTDSNKVREKFGESNNDCFTDTGIEPDRPESPSCLRTIQSKYQDNTVIANEVNATTDSDIKAVSQSKIVLKNAVISVDERSHSPNLDEIMDDIQNEINKGTTEQEANMKVLQNKTSEVGDTDKIPEISSTVT